MFGSVAAVEGFISEFPLIFDLIEEQCDELGDPVGEGGSVGIAVVAAPGTVNIMHCLEILGDLAGVHAAPANSVLVGECFSEDGI